MALFNSSSSSSISFLDFVRSFITWAFYGLLLNFYSLNLLRVLSGVLEFLLFKGCLLIFFLTSSALLFEFSLLPRKEFFLVFLWSSTFRLFELRFVCFENLLFFLVLINPNTELSSWSESLSSDFSLLKSFSTKFVIPCFFFLKPFFNANFAVYSSKLYPSDISLIWSS